jgi:hypothetical protein
MLPMRAHIDIFVSNSSMCNLKLKNCLIKLCWNTGVAFKVQELLKLSQPQNQFPLKSFLQSYDRHHSFQYCTCSFIYFSTKPRGGLSVQVWSKYHVRGCIQKFLHWPQMVQLSATRCNCIAILWVSLVSFAAITLCVASQRVFIVTVVVYFVIDSVRKLLNTPSYACRCTLLAFIWSSTWDSLHQFPLRTSFVSHFLFLTVGNMTLIRHAPGRRRMGYSVNSTPLRRPDIGSHLQRAESPPKPFRYERSFTSGLGSFLQTLNWQLQETERSSERTGTRCWASPPIQKAFDFGKFMWLNNCGKKECSAHIFQMRSLKFSITSWFSC